MAICRAIYISANTAKELQDILDIKEGFYEECYRDGTIETFTADFGNGIEADIKVCNGDTPYVDAVLFEDGKQIALLDVEDTLVGEYRFDYDDNEYVVYILPETDYSKDHYDQENPLKCTSTNPTRTWAWSLAGDRMDTMGDIFYDIRDDEYGDNERPYEDCPGESAGERMQCYIKETIFSVILNAHACGFADGGMKVVDDFAEAAR